MKSIQPLNGYVVLKPVEEQEQMFGSIVMPDMGKEKPEMGIVVSVSPIYNFNTDTEVQSKLWPGSVVMIPKMGSMKITIEQQDYFLCKETEILGIIVNE